METIRELWAFMRVRKKYWLAPIILALLALGGLFVLAAKAGTVSIFMYAL